MEFLKRLCREEDGQGLIEYYICCCVGGARVLEGS